MLINTNKNVQATDVAPQTNQRTANQTAAHQNSTVSNPNPVTSTPAATKSESVSVSLTSAGARLAQLETQQTNSQTPVNQSKVQKLKQSIQSGTYQINPNRIAGKMISDLASKA